MYCFTLAKSHTTRSKTKMMIARYRTSASATSWQRLHASHAIRSTSSKTMQATSQQQEQEKVNLDHGEQPDNRGKSELHDDAGPTLSDFIAGVVPRGERWSDYSGKLRRSKDETQQR